MCSGDLLPCYKQLCHLLPKNEEEPLDRRGRRGRGWFRRARGETASKASPTRAALGRGESHSHDRETCARSIGLPDGSADDTLLAEHGGKAAHTSGIGINSKIEPASRWSSWQASERHSCKLSAPWRPHHARPAYYLLVRQICSTEWSAISAASSGVTFWRESKAFLVQFADEAGIHSRDGGRWHIRMAARACHTHVT